MVVGRGEGEERLMGGAPLSGRQLNCERRARERDSAWHLALLVQCGGNRIILVGQLCEQAQV